MPSNQIRANFAAIEQLAADQGALAGNVENLRAQLRRHAQEALSALDGGMGSAEHQACMNKVDQLIDEFLTSTKQMQRSTGQVNESFQAAGHRAKTILGSGT